MVFNQMKSDALFSQAQRLSGTNRWDEAIPLFDQAIGFNPKSAGAYLHKALALAENGNEADAMECLLQAIRLKPKNPVYPMFLGLIQYDCHDYNAAHQAFDKALAIDPHYEIARVLKNLTDFTTGNKEEALARFKGNYNWGLDFQSRLLVVCESYLNQHNTVAASYFESDLSLANDNGSRFRHLKNVLLKWKFGFLLSYNQVINPDAAKREMKERFLRGNRHLAFKEYDQALEEYQKIVEDGHPRLSAKALQQIVEVYLAKCDFQNALKYVELVEEFQSTLSFLDQLPDRPDTPSQYPALHSELVLVMGIIHYELGNYTKSADILMMAAELDPKNFLAYYYLGLAALAASGPDQSRISRNWFKKALGAVNEGLLAKRVDETRRIFRIVNG